MSSPPKRERDSDGALVWVGSGPVRAESAKVAFDDHGVTVGDGVFETVAIRHGAPFALDAHLDRLARSAELMGLPAPQRSAVVTAVEAVIGSTVGSSRTRFLRITLTAGRGPLGSPRSNQPSAGCLIVAERDGSVRTDPTSVGLGPWIRNERSPLAGVKSTSYAENVVALAAGAVAGCSETLFANTRDELCEGTGSNVVVVHGGRLITPPLDSGCLAGVTRSLLIETMRRSGHPVEEHPIEMALIDRIDAAALLSTGREVQPIESWRRFDVAAVPGPLAERVVVRSERRLDAAHPLVAAMRSSWVERFGTA